MRVRLILIGVVLMIIGIVLAAVLAFTTWGTPREYWIEVETDTVGGGSLDQSPNSFSTYLSRGYYALTASGGSSSNYSYVSPYVRIEPYGGLDQIHDITPGVPVYFKTYYDDTYTFHFFLWYPEVATISKQMYQRDISYRNLSPVGVLIALGGVAFLIVGAISTPSEPGAAGGKNTMIRLRQY